MLIKSSQNAHRYIHFKNGRIATYQTHEKDQPGLISGLGCLVKAALSLAIFCVGFLGGIPVFAELPSGYTTVSGSASFQNDGTVLNINASNGVIINYNRFNIGQGNTVNIFSPLSLHRVTGVEPSQILGTLNSTGKVFLVNPSGIFFGVGSQVNVQSLVASTLNIQNNDFLAGNYTFANELNLPVGAIINHGQIKATEAVALLGSAIQNTGTIEAPQVHMAVGDQISYHAAPGVVIDVTVDQSLKSKVEGYQSAISNSGLIAGEQVKLQAKLAQSFYDSAVNNAGFVRAVAFGKDRSGKIVAVGQSDDLNAVVRNSGSLIATGTGDSPDGGHIYLEGNTTLNTGALLATSEAGGKGGTVHMLGDTVQNLAGSHIDASGDVGGGTVLIGGDYQGTNPQIRNASFNYMDSQARISANALRTGNGGKVILWADDKTVFNGKIEAKGGTQSGNGGFVETSGHNILQAQGSVDASATNGQAGQWLLDPNNITIQNTGVNTNVASSGTDPVTYDTTNNTAIVTSGTIQAALNAGTSVTIQTSSAGTNSQLGDINVSAGTTIAKTTGGDATLTLKAHNSILMNGTSGSRVSITSTNNKLGVVLNADSDASGAGAIKLDYTTLTSNGGDITMGGGADPLTTSAKGLTGTVIGIGLIGSTLSAAGGNISMRGQGNTTAIVNSNMGVSLDTTSVVSTTSGNLSVIGNGGGPVGQNTGLNHGVYLNSSSQLNTTSGTLSITGTGSGYGSSSGNYGVHLDNSSQVNTTSGDLNVIGNGSATSTGSAYYGVFLTNSAQMNTTTGNLSVTGTGGGTGGTSSVNFGVNMTIGSLLSTTTGNLSIIGNGGRGSSTYGVNMSASNLTTSTGGISVTGLGGNGSAGDRGVNIIGGSQIKSTGMLGGSPINITGTGTGGGGNDNLGVYLSGSNTLITSQTGDITVTGQGSLTGVWPNYGLSLNSGAQITSTGSANIILNLFGGAGTPSTALYHNNAGGTTVIGGNSMTGNLTINANNYTNSAGTLSLQTAGNLILSPTANNTAITMGTNNATWSGLNWLGLLDRTTVSPNRLIIGNSMGATGTTTISNGWNPGWTVPVEVYNGVINTQGIDNGGADLLLSALTGDLNVTSGSNTTFNKTDAADSTLTFKAAGSVVFNGTNVTTGSITANATGAGKRTVIINADSDGNGAGRISQTYTTITSNGGDITLGGGANPLTGSSYGVTGNITGISLINSSLSSGAGNISLRGQGSTTTANSNSGISLINSSVSTSSGTLTAYGVGGGLGTGTGNNGVSLSGATSLLTTVTGNILLTGRGGAGTGTNNNGLSLANGTNISSTGSGNIVIDVLKGTSTFSYGLSTSTGTYILGGNTMTGNLTLIADTYGTGGTLKFQTAGNLTLKPYTDSTNIALGTNNATWGGTNWLSYLDRTTVSPNRLIIGNSTGASGATTITSGWNPGWSTPLEIYGGSITTGSINNGSSSILLRSLSGDLTLNSGTTLTSNATGNAIVLAAGQNFVNNSNASALSAANGRWLLYSSSPANTTLGGLTFAAKRYNRTFAANAPGTITETGNVGMYSIAPVLTVTADDKTRLYGDNNPTFTGTLSGFIDGDTTATAAITGAASFSTAPASADVGTYSITGTVGSLASIMGYQFNSNLTPGTLSVTPAALTVTANNATRLYGDNNPSFSASYAGFKLGQDTSVLGGALSLSTPATNASNVGSYSITPSGWTSTNYNISNVAGSLSVTPAALTVTANNATRLYGDNNPSFSASYAGFKLGQDTSVLSGALSLSTPATNASNVGSYSITPSGWTSTNYNISNVAGSLSVTPAALTVTANNATRLYGDNNPSFSASYAGFKLGQDTSVLGGALSLSTPATNASNVGSYSITPSGWTSTNYDITNIAGTLTVNPLAQTSTGSSVDTNTLTNNTIPYLLFTSWQNPIQNIGIYNSPLIKLLGINPGLVSQSGLLSNNSMYQISPDLLKPFAKPASFLELKEHEKNEPKKRIEP